MKTKNKILTLGILVLLLCFESSSVQAMEGDETMGMLRRGGLWNGCRGNQKGRGLSGAPRALRSSGALNERSTGDFFKKRLRGGGCNVVEGGRYTKAMTGEVQPGKSKIDEVAEKLGTPQTFYGRIEGEVLILEEPGLTDPPQSELYTVFLNPPLRRKAKKDNHPSASSHDEFVDAMDRQMRERLTGDLFYGYQPSTSSISDGHD